MKKILISLLFLAFPLSGYSANWHVEPRSVNENINAVVIINNCWIGVGNNGLIIKSDENWHSYSVRPSPLLENFISICTDSLNKVWVLTHQKKVLQSNDQGETWQIIGDLSTIGIDSVDLFNIQYSGGVYVTGSRQIWSILQEYAIGVAIKYENNVWHVTKIFDCAISGVFSVKNTISDDVILVGRGNRNAFINGDPFAVSALDTSRKYELMYQFAWSEITAVNLVGEHHYLILRAWSPSYQDRSIFRVDSLLNNVMVGVGMPIYYSYNGHTSGVNAYITSLAKADSLFGIEQGKNMIISTSDITSHISFTAPSSINCITSFNGKIIAVGDSGLVLLNFDNPLPVNLSTFNGHVDNAIVLLQWSTTSELNNSGFNIERKYSTLSDWTVVGNANGHGSSSTIHHYTFTDRNMGPGIYNYRLKQIDYNGNFEYHYLRDEVTVGLPEEFELYQNYPNPFNPVTTVRFSLPVSGHVNVKIFDSSGKEIKTLVNEFKTAGYYNLFLDASSFSSGTYFYKLETTRYTETKKMILIK